MKKYFTLAICLLLMLVTVAGCAPAMPQAAPAADSATGTPTIASAATVCAVDDPNFLLLISDEPNDIGDFSELWVLISGVGFVLGDEEGIVESPFAEPVEVNLVGLTGDAAIALWAGYVPEGDYTKVFIYVDEVWGVSSTTGEIIEIKLPSNKLQLDMPVVVEGDEPAEFVFDITVLRAGNSGQYILKPQVSESGQGAQYRLLEQTQERVRVERPDWAGKPDWTGKPDDAGQPDDEEPGQPASASTPDYAGKPDWSADDEPGRPEGAGRPDGSGRPT